MGGWRGVLICVKRKPPLRFCSWLRFLGCCVPVRLGDQWTWVEYVLVVCDFCLFWADNLIIDLVFGRLPTYEYRARARGELWTWWRDLKCMRRWCDDTCIHWLLMPTVLFTELRSSMVTVSRFHEHLSWNKSWHSTLMLLLPCRRGLVTHGSFCCFLDNNSQKSALFLQLAAVGLLERSELLLPIYTATKNGQVLFVATYHGMPSANARSLHTV